MRPFIKVTKALSDPSRVKIIRLLQQRSLCVCEIQAAFELAQPAISKHLEILKKAGLVTYRKNGLWVNHALADGKSNPHAATRLGNLRHPLENDPEIMGMAERLPEITREQICRKS